VFHPEPTAPPPATTDDALVYLDALLRALLHGFDPDLLERQITLRCGDRTHRLAIDHALIKGRSVLASIKTNR
jgi:hypothetical protein